MVIFPNCKINLGLWVTEKLRDGYHAIETIFFPVPISDILEIIPAAGGKTEITVSGIDVAVNQEDNICIKAWKIIDEEFHIGPVQIYLHKQIPTGAGLGGGSSDAAFTLKALNQLFKLGLNNFKLKRFAFKLGMDCPFFIDNKPAYATGKGEVLTPVGLSLSGMYLSLVKPPVDVSTTEAYARVKPVKRSNTLNEVLSFPIETWKEKLNNDFEYSVFAAHPEIREIKETLYSKGALYASMSGSGSSVYGLFWEEPSSGISFPGYYQKTILL
jgi:4-diphosphocytidyl-2-C-methyl-D-erythritol kinase